MIDILTWQEDDVTYYRKVEVDITSMHALPEGEPPNAGVISANDWHSEAFVGSVPEMDEEGNTRTFEQREAAYIEKLGWKPAQ
jgi:hypothetical protein